MPKAKNITTVSDLKEKLSRAKSVVVTDYRGLTHKQLEELHRVLKKVNAEYLVVKNSLLRISSQDTNYQLLTTDLTGPTAALLSYDDEIAPLKELAKTIKNLSLPKIKFGFISGSRYSDQEVESIAKLPGKEVLQGQLVSRLSSPMSGLVYSLNYNLQQLAYVLANIKK